MFRFEMPDNTLEYSLRLKIIRDQIGEFMSLRALSDIFSLLEVDRDTIGEVYNGRMKNDGRVHEIQALVPKCELEDIRYALYPLFMELGFFDINKPLRTDFSHILVLGGSLNANFDRTHASVEWITETTRFVEGLSCYRPINPIERRDSVFQSAYDTEFGVMSDAFASVFALSSSDWKDDFVGDRNLNRSSCIRSFNTAPGGRAYRVFAAPSTQVELRRADTGDSLLFFLDHTELCPDDSLLAVTNNMFCNRQFLQLAYCLMKRRSPVNFDIVGCLPEDRISTRDNYDPFRYIQELIALLSWIERFHDDF
ncbi:MAG: hypothetical protein IJH37_04725 [Clostridia bacterium]|nr:hypothetical protein [Clostridia bacterium]